MYSSLLIGLSLTVGAPASKEAPKADPAKFAGEWVIEKYVNGGKVDDKRAGTEVKITADEITPGKEPPARYTLDPKADPPRIDLTADNKTIPGIYKLEGDTLTICFPKGKGERPAKFESPDGSRIILMILKRAK
jgi:uncharacterized protein (TIGR03067 family)